MKITAMSEKRQETWKVHGEHACIASDQDWLTPVLHAHVLKYCMTIKEFIICDKDMRWYNHGLRLFCNLYCQMI